MSADFLNFGTEAIELAGITGIVGEEMRMLRGAKSVGGGPHKCKHCGSMHPTRAALTAHYRYEHPPNRGIHESHASHQDDWEFDFRI